jgi:alpha-tubulin suppressor-like RCC1 family protein
MKNPFKKRLRKDIFLKTHGSFMGVLLALGFASPASAMQPLGGTTKLAAGEWHTCAMGGGGVVKCWGFGWEGSLGTGAADIRAYAANVIGLGEAAADVSVGLWHSCARTVSGAIKCWGSNLRSESGGSVQPSYLPNTVSGLGSGALALATRYMHSCAVTAAGGVKCWGYNDSGQLGGGNVGPAQGVPVDVVGLTGGATGVATAEFSSCAIVAGKVKCWGSDPQAGLAPQEVAGLSGITQIVGGMQHYCALSAAGGVKCWGQRPGDGSAASASPVDVTGLSSGVALLAAGLYHTCAITQGGATWCWGKNDWGQLGDGTREERLQPVDVTANVGALAAIGAGGVHSCGAAANGDTRCWGTYLYGRLGNNEEDDLHVQPVAVVGLGSGTAQVSAAHNYTCATTTGGGAKCWGLNNSGYLGDGTRNLRGAPVDVTGLTSGVLSVATSAYHACAVSSGGGVKCWGLNMYGALGNAGAGPESLVPVDVTGLGAAATAVTAGVYFSCAIVSGGGVKCWGRNDQGQLGNNTLSDSTSPVDVIGLDGVAVQITAGSAHACAVTSTGRAQCWGVNEFGQLGDGTRVRRLTATTVSGMESGIVAITSRQSTSCALTSAGAMKCWGGNWIGQLGDGTNVSVRDLPAQVVGLTSGVQSMSVHQENTCAVMTSGQLKCWGSNFSGNLGRPVGTPGYSNTPLDVPGQSNVSSVSVGATHNCSISTGGALQCWGNNEYGALGSGTLAIEFAPVSVLTYDTVPDAFSFAPKQNVAPGTSQVSAPATITGLESAAPISVSGGEYSIGCGATYTSAPGEIAPNSSVCVRHQSAAAPGASVTTTLVIGGVSAVFTSTTSRGGDLAVRSDFNGDGRSDILWYHTVVGGLYQLLMNGLATGSAAVIDQETDLNWKVAAVGDLNGDGRVDIVWQHDTTGEVRGLLMDGATVLSEGTIYTEPNTQWKVVGAGDFNGDGNADLLWKNNTTGDVFLFLLNGLNVVSGGVIYSEPNTNWVIQKVADFNGDGRADVLWRNVATGDVFVLLMNGTTVTGGGVIYSEPNTAWQIQAAADFNGDGRADVLWRNTTTGDVYMMLMNGTTITGGSVFYGEPNAAWKIVATGDYNGDGRADILWRNTATGQVFMMLMDGFTISGGGFVYTETDQNWKILGP